MNEGINLYNLDASKNQMMIETPYKNDNFIQNESNFINHTNLYLNSPNSKILINSSAKFQ
jgi:hypothetical protein